MTTGTRAKLKHGRLVCPANLALVRTFPCLITGGRSDPCHYPRRRSQGGDDGLLNLIPLSRPWHERLDTFDPFTVRTVEKLAARHFKLIMIQYAYHYLGSDERIQEVRDSSDRPDS